MPAQQATPIITVTTDILPTQTLPTLTTVFTPPASCFSDIYVVGPLSVLQIFPSFKEECYPPYGAATPTFSPGICPLNYTTVLVNIITGRTTATCCPSLLAADSTFNMFIDSAGARSGFTLGTVSLTTNSSTVGCAAIMTESVLINGGPTTYSDSDGNAAAVTYYTTTTPSSQNALGGVVAPPFVAMWATTDTAIVSLLASPSSHITPSATSLNTSTTISTSSSSSPSPVGSHGSSSLSGGAIAGIVVGAVAGIALVVGMLLVLLKRRRNNRTVKAAATWRKPELEDTKMGPREMPDTGRNELQGSMPPELHDGSATETAT